MTYTEHAARVAIQLHSRMAQSESPHVVCENPTNDRHHHHTHLERMATTTTLDGSLGKV